MTQVLSILDLGPDALDLSEQQTGPGMVSERTLRALKGSGCSITEGSGGKAPGQPGVKPHVTDDRGIERPRLERGRFGARSGTHGVPARSGTHLSHPTTPLAHNLPR